MPDVQFTDSTNGHETSRIPHSSVRLVCKLSAMSHVPETQLQVGGYLGRCRSSPDECRFSDLPAGRIQHHGIVFSARCGRARRCRSNCRASLESSTIQMEAWDLAGVAWARIETQASPSHPRRGSFLAHSHLELTFPRAGSVTFHNSGTSYAYRRRFFQQWFLHRRRSSRRQSHSLAGRAVFIANLHCRICHGLVLLPIAAFKRRANRGALGGE